MLMGHPTLSLTSHQVRVELGYGHVIVERTVAPLFIERDEQPEPSESLRISAPPCVELRVVINTVEVAVVLVVEAVSDLATRSTFGIRVTAPNESD
jgi:hypothetical protein